MRGTVDGKKEMLEGLESKREARPHTMRRGSGRGRSEMGWSNT